MCSRSPSLRSVCTSSAYRTSLVSYFLKFYVSDLIIIIEIQRKHDIVLQSELPLGVHQMPCVHLSVASLCLSSLSPLKSFYSEHKICSFLQCTLWKCETFVILLCCSLKCHVSYFAFEDRTGEVQVCRNK